MKSKFFLGRHTRAKKDDLGNSTDELQLGAIAEIYTQFSNSSIRQFIEDNKLEANNVMIRYARGKIRTLVTAYAEVAGAFGLSDDNIPDSKKEIFDLEIQHKFSDIQPQDSLLSHDPPEYVLGDCSIEGYTTGGTNLIMELWLRDPLATEYFGEKARSFEYILSRSGAGLQDMFSYAIKNQKQFGVMTGQTIIVEPTMMLLMHPNLNEMIQKNGKLPSELYQMIGGQFQEGESIKINMNYEGGKGTYSIQRQITPTSIIESKTIPLDELMNKKFTAHLS